MSVVQFKSFGPRAGGREDPERVKRELAGIEDNPKDPNWLTTKQTAAILGLSIGQVHRPSIVQSLRAVAAYKHEGCTVLYALLDIERIGALKRHNNVNILEACRMFCEENQ